MRNELRRGGGGLLAGGVLVVSTLALAVGLRPAGAAVSAWHWQGGHGHRSAPVALPGGEPEGFTSLAFAETGVSFTNRLSSERGLTNQILFSGSGVAAGDVDGDGWCDLFFSGLDGESVLYRNLGGMKFRRVEPGPDCAGWTATGSVLADVDGDGDLDLLVTTLGQGVHLFLNDGGGRFEEVTVAAGLADGAGSMSMALADVDGDGDLDLYVTNYRSDTLQDKPNTRFEISSAGVPRIVSVDGRPAASGEVGRRYSVDPVTRQVVEHGQEDSLFINEGGGRYSRAGWGGGRFLDEDGRVAETPRDWGLTVMFRDIDRDGVPDLYVCNDGDSIDRIWIGDGKGGFRAVSRLALRKTSFSSMGVDFADVNRDGWDEIYVSDMLGYEHGMRQTQMVDRRQLPVVGIYDDRPGYMQNTLFLNRGDGTYAEIAFLAGVEASDWSWMPLFMDVDLDGYEDLLVTTGLPLSFRDADARRQIDQARGGGLVTAEGLAGLRRAMPPLHTPNFAFRNRGDLTFSLESRRWGFDSRAVSHGMALADLDNDGDQDVVVNCMNAPALIYRNNATAARVAVRLKGRSPNTEGVGARVKLSGGVVVQSQEMISGGRYLSGDQAMRVFAAGSGPMMLEVEWRSGARTVLTNVVANRVYEIDETYAVAGPRPVRAEPAPMFEDVSVLLGHRHQDPPFDEFARQPLIGRDLSRMGPSVAWYDMDGSGTEDLIVSDGLAGELTIYLNDGAGGFSRLGAAEMMGRNRVDNGMVLGWTPAEGTGSFLVGLSNYEGGGVDVPAMLRFDIQAGGARQVQALPGQPSTSGPAALADLDGDGDLDLVVGGVVIPGRYPEAASTRVFLNQGGQFLLDAQASGDLKEVGLVRGLVLTDLTGDGNPEVVLACEWGPVRVFGWGRGRLTEMTESLGLGGYRGWWTGVAAGDLDGDGRLDLVVGNWGRNTREHRYMAQPLRVYYGDLHGDGTVEVVYAHHEPGLNKVVPWAYWDSLTRAIPAVQERWTSFRSYSERSVEEILGGDFGRMKELQVTTLDSMIFLNRGGKFEARPLPLEAQMAPVFGVNIADLDGDGLEDLFLSQNFFGVDSETPRYDAGRGLVLKGDGAGGMTPVGGRESGIRVYGEQRGSALSDFDADGQVDIVVTQNGAETKLYRNRVGMPGLRVIAQGPPHNPSGIGAVIRLKADGGMGPAREVRAGSGYWSQDGAIQVMTSARRVRGIWIRWPGGRIHEAEIPPTAREVILDYSGRVGVK